MPASLTMQKAVEPKVHPKKARFFFLAITALVIVVLAAAWLIVSSNISRPTVPHISVLDLEIKGHDFSSDSTADELLALADHQSQRILDAFPNLAAAHSVKANRDYVTGDLVLAKAAWIRALELDPQSSDAMLGLSIIAFEAGEYERSIELCEQCMFTNAGNPRIPLLLAENYIQDGKPEKAILVLSQHIASEPTSVQAYEVLGTAYLNLRDYQNAIVQFKRVLTFSPNSKDSFYGLAQANAKLGRAEEAKTYMAKFSELSVNASSTTQKGAQAFKDRAFAAHVAAQVYVDSGMIYREFGDRKSEEECLLRAQKLQPNVIVWLAELQKCFLVNGQLREAADVAERLVQLEPNRVDYWLQLGQLLSDLGMADPAIEAFEKAVKLAPDDDRCKRADVVLRKLKAK